MLNLANKPRLSISLPAALLITAVTSVVTSLGACAPQQRGMSTMPTAQAATAVQPAFWGWTAEPATQPSGPTFWGFAAERVTQPSGPTFWGFAADPMARQASESTFWGYSIAPAPALAMPPSREAQAPMAAKR
jgi:hypothetical protein